jgi:hypothetical protein
MQQNNVQAANRNLTPAPSLWAQANAAANELTARVVDALIGSGYGPISGEMTK